MNMLKVCDMFQEIFARKIHNDRSFVPVLYQDKSTKKDAVALFVRLEEI